MYFFKLWASCKEKIAIKQAQNKILEPPLEQNAVTCVSLMWEFPEASSMLHWSTIF